MRTVGVIAFLLLGSACSAPEASTDNRAEAEPANGETAEPVSNLPQSPKPAPQAQGHPCSIQDGEKVTQKLKAIGTEPFWAAEVEGRCVTYKTPEHQQGTRVWTKVMESEQQSVWDGAFRGKQFQLTVRPKADCSDGMSDKVYPLEAVLRVDGETRQGCAENR